MKVYDIAALFAAGAYSAVSESGLSGKAADSFVSGVCKQAAVKSASGRYDDDEEEGTWWERNKRWALPTGIGLAAFLIGGDAGRNGRPDKGHFSNALDLFWKRLGALLGFTDNPLWKSVTKIPNGSGSDSGSANGKSQEVLKTDIDRYIRESNSGAGVPALDVNVKGM